MSAIHAVMSTLFAVATLGTTVTAHATNGDATLRADLERIAQKRIFFGHQSVGVNLLDGVEQLAMKAGIPVRIVEIKSASDVMPATIGHTFVARNGDPFQKLQSFEHAMGSHSTGLDIAFVKFCFVDITQETDVKALFASYRNTISGLRAINPGTTFVHVTAPLTIVQGGLKASLKKLLGHPPYGMIENMRREEYNTLLRQAYQGQEPVFDLARIESTAPNGTAISVEWNGKKVPVMDPANTDDGGHLSAAGKQRAARELISVLASIPDRPVPGKTPR